MATFALLTLMVVKCPVGICPTIVRGNLFQLGYRGAVCGNLGWFFDFLLNTAFLDTIGMIGN